MQNVTKSLLISIKYACCFFLAVKRSGADIVEQRPVLSSNEMSKIIILIIAAITAVTKSDEWLTAGFHQTPDADTFEKNSCWPPENRTPVTTDIRFHHFRPQRNRHFEYEMFGQILIGVSEFLVTSNMMHSYGYGSEVILETVRFKIQRFKYTNRYSKFRENPVLPEKSVFISRNEISIEKSTKGSRRVWVSQTCREISSFVFNRLYL